MWFCEVKCVKCGQNSATKMKISQINCGFNVQFRRLHMSYRQRWPIFVMFFIHSIVFCEIFIQNVIHSIIMKFHSFLENIHFIIFGFHSIQKKYSCFKKGPYSIQNFIQFNENLCHSFKKIIHLFEKSVIEHPYSQVISMGDFGPTASNMCYDLWQFF